MKKLRRKHPVQPHETLLQKAIIQHKAGRLQNAERLYRAILQMKPEHPDANHNLGVLALQANQPAAALPHLKTALEANSGQPQFWITYIDALILSGMTEAAKAVLAQARQRGIEGKEMDALQRRLTGPTTEELNELGELFNRKRYAEAYTRALHLTKHFPQSGIGWKIAGLALKLQGKGVEALDYLQRATKLLPKDAETHGNLGVILQEQGLLAEAEAAYRRSLAIKEECAEVYCNLGVVLQDQKRIEEAEGCFRRALAIKPEYAKAYNNIGNIFNLQNRFAEAEASFRRALAIKPDYAEAQNNLGSCLEGQNRFAEAEASYGRAFEIRPDYVEASYNLGNLLREQGRSPEAEACFDRAIAIKPEFVGPHLAKAMMALPIMPETAEASVAVPFAFDRALRELSDRLDASPRLRKNFSEVVGSHQPFYLAYREGNHVERLSHYGDLIAENDPSRILKVTGRKRKKIRLVIVSCHLRRHSVWDIIIRGLLENLDRSKFEVVLYHTGQSEDGETAWAKSQANIWRDVGTLRDFQSWMEAMATDRPDVIFYPEMGMDPVTLRLAAHRLAPIQAAGWGHPITTGLPTIDLYFSGELIEPQGAEKHYRERLVLLPGTGCCTAPIDITPEGLPEMEKELAFRGGPVFAMVQVPFKFDPVNDDIYVDIASRGGNSTFILMQEKRYPWAAKGVFERLSSAFSARGMDPRRHLLMIPWLSRERFYGLLERCDVYLDCPSFSGYTSAWQAIHHGLPVVTQEGGFMRQRLASGLLRKIGMTDTIATSAEDYVSIAVRLAQESCDPDRRQALRKMLKDAASRADQDIGVVRAFERSILDALTRARRRKN